MENDNGYMLYWNGSKPIRELISQLIDLEIEGYSSISLVTDSEEFDLDQEDGAVDIVKVGKLEVYY